MAELEFDRYVDQGMELNKPSQKKPSFLICKDLRSYLIRYRREVKLPIEYIDLQRFTYTSPLKDKQGKYTSWEHLTFDMRDWEYLRDGLVRIYAILKTEGDMSFINHLDVDRIDFCFFGNSQPYRIRIRNKFNDNYDYFYIKKADANRVYGLELEHLLSPNRIKYLTFNNTLVEEHIPGVPGDIFIKDLLDMPRTNKIRLAKEFVKFNERCFVQLLGDMRSYNFVVNIIPDIEDVQYRIRAIDFDQQSYEGRKSLYLPQFFKENKEMVEMVMTYLNKESITQYQTEERTIMTFRVASARYRILDLTDIMSHDNISTSEKTEQLKSELIEYFKNDKYYRNAKNMGQLVKAHLKHTLQKNLILVPKRS